MSLKKKLKGKSSEILTLLRAGVMKTRVAVSFTCKGLFTELRHIKRSLCWKCRL